MFITDCFRAYQVFDAISARHILVGCIDRTCKIISILLITLHRHMSISADMCAIRFG